MKNIVLIIAVLIFTSCDKYDKDYSKFTVTSFSNKRIDTLVPSENKSYVSLYVKIKGYTNDTIKISGIFGMNLSGTIDTLVTGDYYGTHKIICVFDPYKATKGKLDIEYGL